MHPWSIAGDDGFDHPHGRFVEEADEAVGPDDFCRPRPGYEGIVQRRGGHDDAGPAARRQVGLALAAVAVVQFLVSLDLSVVNVGLPRIAVGLGFSAVSLAWVINAYALTFGGLLLLGGRAADRYARRGLGP